MGLITDINRFAVLSDILGYIDLKGTGTSEGITACQMDIKIDGVKYQIMKQALAQARDGRLHILGKLTETLTKLRENVKAHSPKTITKGISNELIGLGVKVI
ncbi:MAG: polyribonucleotide nucleotidyltransferase [Flavobacterium sp.]|jgi:polyribonucleotide nucleotidyltransferase